MADLPESPYAGGDAFGDRDLLFAALRRLPPRQRAVLVLRFWEDRSIEQTAELLDTSIGNVKSTSHRGLERLRTILATTEGASS
jgi:RNA polymerase sigma factor (sigma-70 family)